MRIVEETDALLEKVIAIVKIKSRERRDEYYKEMKHAEHNKSPKRPVYPEFDITNEAAHLVESESISNSDIAIIITDHNGKIISTSEPVTKDMQKQLTCKTETVPDGGLVVERNWKNQSSSQQ